MDGIKIEVTGNIAKVIEKPRRITSGTIGLPVEFTFDSQWDGLSKKAVFRTGHFSIVCDLNEAENTVPWEVLVFPNMWLSVGVYGVNEGGTISIPTIWVNVSVIQPGTVPDGASPAEPTPPVWQRIEDEVKRIGSVVDATNRTCEETKQIVAEFEENVDRKLSDASKASKEYTDTIANDTINKLCPSFSESGVAVRCEPVEGYPLKVVTKIPILEDGIISITLTQCGKNLFDYTAYPFEDYLIYDAGGAANVSSSFSAFRNYMPVGHLKGLTITLNHPGAESNQYTHAALVFYDADKKYISGSNGYSHVVPDNAEYIRFSVPRKYADGTQVQLELGSQVTACEPYWQWEYTAEFDEPVREDGSYVWSNIEAHAGVNTIWSSVGTTSVEGKSDPVAIIEKLTNAVISLGGNI